MTEHPRKVLLHEHELEELNAYLQDASVTRILLQGDPGSGRRALVWSALDEYNGSVLQVVCAPVLSTVPFAALSPILGGNSEVGDALDALRKTKAALKSTATRTGVEGAILVVIFNAEHMDISSAYVLGQLVDSKSLRLLMVSTLGIDQCEALMETGAPDDLRSVVVAPLSPTQVSQLCQSEYGVPLTSGASLTIASQCYGNLHLTRLFLKLAQRQQALLATGSHWHLKWHVLAFDSEQSMGVQQLHQQLMPEIRSVLEVLAVAERMTVDSLKAVLPSHGLELQLPHVVLRHEDDVQISPFYAVGLRGSMSLARREEILSLLQTSLTDPEWSEYFHRSVLSDVVASTDPSESLAVVRAANDSANYRIALRLINQDVTGELGLGHGLEYIRASLATFRLAEAKTEVVRMLNSGVLEPQSPISELLALAIEWSAGRNNQPGYDNLWVPVDEGQWNPQKHRSRLDLKDSGKGHGDATNWDDKAWLGYLQELQTLWNSGQLERLDRSVEPGAERTLAHAMSYRLASLVKKSLSLISSGLLDGAAKLLGPTWPQGPACYLYSNGSIEFLRGLVAVNQGRYVEASDCLVRAKQELTLHDPESLYDYCCEQISHLNRILGSRNQLEPTGRGSMSSNGGVARIDDLATAEDFLDSSVLGNTDLKPLHDIVVSTSRSRKHWQSKPLVWEYLFRFLGAEQTEESMGILLQQLEAAMPAGAGNTASAVRQFLTAWMDVGIEQMNEIVQGFRRAGQVPLALNSLAQMIHRMSQVGLKPEGRHLIALHELVDRQDAPVRGVVASIVQSHGLTAREWAIVDLLRQGATNPDIARALTVSQRTAEGHVYRTFQKLGIRKRSEIGTLGN